MGDEIKWTRHGRDREPLQRKHWNLSRDPEEQVGLRHLMDERDVMPVTIID